MVEAADEPRQPFRAQHGTLVEKTSGSGAARVVVDLDESPVGALARRAGKGGEPWLGAACVEAAERLRRDFEIGRLQPRVTANWSASVSTGRRCGRRGSCGADRDGARSPPPLRPRDARRRPGALRRSCRRLLLPEGSRDGGAGAAMAGPLGEARASHRARCACATLRADATATGRPGSGKLRHWGAEDYRPEIA